MLLQLKKHALAGHVVNMSDWTNAFAFDVVGELAYGSSLGHLETQSDVLDLRKNIYQLFYFSSCMGHYVGQTKWLTNPITQGILSLCGVRNRIAEFQSWSAEQVQSRIAAMKQDSQNITRADMLDHFLRMKTPEGNHVRFEEVLSEALNLV